MADDDAIQSKKDETGSSSSSSSNPKPDFKSFGIATAKGIGAILLTVLLGTICRYIALTSPFLVADPVGGVPPVGMFFASVDGVAMVEDATFNAGKYWSQKGLLAYLKEKGATTSWTSNAANYYAAVYGTVTGVNNQFLAAVYGALNGFLHEAVMVALGPVLFGVTAVVMTIMSFFVGFGAHLGSLGELFGDKHSLLWNVPMAMCLFFPTVFLLFCSPGIVALTSMLSPLSAEYDGKQHYGNFVTATVYYSSQLLSLVFALVLALGAKAHLGTAFVLAVLAAYGAMYFFLGRSKSCGPDRSGFRAVQKQQGGAKGKKDRFASLRLV
jgi:hypothetical protein